MEGPAGVRLFDLGMRDCRYIIDRWNGESRFCGAQTFKNYSYCREHCEVCFSPGKWSAEAA